MKESLVILSAAKNPRILFVAAMLSHRARNRSTHCGVVVPVEPPAGEVVGDVGEGEVGEVPNPEEGEVPKPEPDPDPNPEASPELAAPPSKLFFAFNCSIRGS